MKTLLDFIIEQGLNLNDYPTLLQPLRDKFKITHRHSGAEATEELITAVIFWEKHTEISGSLENFLTERFIVEVL